MLLKVLQVEKLVAHPTKRLTLVEALAHRKRSDLLLHHRSLLRLRLERVEQIVHIFRRLPPHFSHDIGAKLEENWRNHEKHRVRSEAPGDRENRVANNLASAPLVLVLAQVDDDVDQILSLFHLKN